MSQQAKADALALIREGVNTYEKVYVLMKLFVRRTWNTPEELAESIGISTPLIDETLAELVEAGLLVHHEYDASFLYATGDPDRDAKVTALCQLSEDDPLELARQLNAAALRRARNAIDARLISAFAPEVSRRTRRMG